MTDFKQTDPRWKDLIYQAGLTYGADACFLTSLGNLVNLDPVTTAQKLIAGGGLVNGNIVSQVSADILGLEYNGTSNTKPDYDCIAMTDYFEAEYKSEHFFIVKSDGSIQDPLGLNINYPIVNYRLFKAKGELMTQQGILNVLTYERSRNNLSLTDGGLQADVTACLAGDDNTMTDILKAYSEAGDLIHKSECPVCPPCPPCDCPPATDLSNYILKSDCDARLDTQISNDKTICEDQIKNALTGMVPAGSVAAIKSNPSEIPNSSTPVITSAIHKSILQEIIDFIEGKKS